MKTSRIFRTMHIKVEIRMPTAKHLDVEDEVDREEMVKIVQKEWVHICSEIEEMLYIKKESKSPSLRDMFP